jgi:hypothetical protein
VDREPEDRDFVLLGIKYEAAALGGVDEAGLARIEEQIQAEAGDSWVKHPMVIRGRNAVRTQHGLAPLGAPPRELARGAEPAGRPLWRRLFGK